MPPLDPIEFRILENMKTALQNISTEGGYHYDIETVAVKLDPNHDVEAFIGEANLETQPLRPFVLLVADPDAFEHYPAKQIRLLMPFTIHAVHDSDPKDDAALSLTHFKLCADIEKAIATDITRGDLATDTRIFEREMHEPTGQLVWSMLRGEMRVQRTYGAPNG